MPNSIKIYSYTPQSWYSWASKWSSWEKLIVGFAGSLAICRTSVFETYTFYKKFIYWCFFKIWFPGHMLFDRMIVSCVPVLHQSCQIFTSCSSSPLASTSCPVFLTSPGLLLYPPHLLFVQLPTTDPLNCFPLASTSGLVFLTNLRLLLYPLYLHCMLNYQKNMSQVSKHILSHLPNLFYRFFSSPWINFLS